MKGKTIKAEMKNSYGSNIQSVKNFAEILLCNKLSNNLLKPVRTRSDHQTVSKTTCFT